MCHRPSVNGRLRTTVGRNANNAEMEAIVVWTPHQTQRNLQGVIARRITEKGIEDEQSIEI